MKNIFGILGKTFALGKVKSSAKLTEIAKIGLLVLLSMNMPGCKTDPFENSLKNFDKGLLPEKKDFDYDPQLHSNLNNYLEQFRNKLLEKVKNTSFLGKHNIVLEKDSLNTVISFEHDSTEYAITVPSEPVSGDNYIELVARSGNGSRVFKIYEKKILEEQNILSITGTDTTTVVNKIPFDPKHLSDIEHIVGHSAKKLNLEGVDTISWELATDPEYLEKLKPINDFWELLQTTLVDEGEFGTKSEIPNDDGLTFEVEGNEMVYTWVENSTISVRFSKNKKDGIVMYIEDGASHEEYLISMDGTRLTGTVYGETMKSKERYEKLLWGMEGLKMAIPQKYIDEFNDSKAEKILKD